MEKVSPPTPTEQTLTNLVTRHVKFPNGMELRLTLSEWTWEVIAFLDQWRIQLNYEQGILYEWFKLLPFESVGGFTPERSFANTVMGYVRDTYNEWLQDEEPGAAPTFTLPPRR